MCEKLDYDRKQDCVLFLRDLREEHDKLVQLIQVQQNAEMDQMIREIYPVLEQQYLNKEADHLIWPPRDFEDFIKEGDSLMHCVCANEYYQIHVAGKRLIFFVRETNTPDKSLCTLEYDVQRQKILQLRGRRNQAAPPEVKEFVERWLKVKCLEPQREQVA